MWSVIFCVMLLLYLASISIFDAPDTVVLSKRSDDNHIRHGSFDCDCRYTAAMLLSIFAVLLLALTRRSLIVSWFVDRCFLAATLLPCKLMPKYACLLCHWYCHCHLPTFIVWLCCVMFHLYLPRRLNWIIKVWILMRDSADSCNAIGWWRDCFHSPSFARQVG